MFRWPNHTIDDFSEGQVIFYVPKHLQPSRFREGDPGTVHRIGEIFVFVDFRGLVKGCKPSDLLIIPDDLVQIERKEK